MRFIDIHFKRGQHWWHIQAIRDLLPPVPLTNAIIKEIEPSNKITRHFDGGGLYLEVAKNGGKYWRIKYRLGGKEKRLSLGVYPDVTLKEARLRRDEIKRQLADGIDPGIQRKVLKYTNSNADSFEAIAREWFDKHKPNWSDSHSSRILRRLEKDVFPWIGDQPILNITPPQLLTVLRRIESRGAIETAHRIHQNCGQIYRYAIATGRAERDASADLRGAIPPTKARHHPSITDTTELGKLLNAIDEYEGSLVTKCALQIAPLVFVRPGELRHAEWHEFDFDNAEWRIPEHKMKGRIQHIVPLSEQSLKILEQLQPVTARGKFVFPSIRSNERPMSENTVNAALRRLGYTKDEMTGHGFRSIASTLLNEQGWHSDAIERQLAHCEKNSVRAAYNYAEHLPLRREMMQAWADYLNKLKKSDS